nr:hypothetical protein [Brevibacillus sp. CF112]
MRGENIVKDAFAFLGLQQLVEKRSALANRLPRVPANACRDDADRRTDSKRRILQLELDQTAVRDAQLGLEQRGHFDDIGIRISLVLQYGCDDFLFAQHDRNFLAMA